MGPKRSAQLLDMADELSEIYRTVEDLREKYDLIPAATDQSIAAVLGDLRLARSGLINSLGEAILGEHDGLEYPYIS